MKIVAAAVLLTSLCFVANAYAKPLTGDELRAKMVGKTCNWKNGSASGVSVDRPDGIREITMADGSKIAEKWAIKGNKMCAIANSKGDKDKCWTVEETGPNTFKGSIGFTSTCN